MGWLSECNSSGSGTEERAVPTGEGFVVLILEGPLGAECCGTARSLEVQLPGYVRAAAAMREGAGSE